MIPLSGKVNKWIFISEHYIYLILKKWTINLNLWYVKNFISSFIFSISKNLVIANFRYKIMDMKGYYSVLRKHI